MIRAFRKIGGAFKAIGKLIIRREVLSTVKNVAVFIPVAGPAIATALDYVEAAERKFSKPHSGEEKMLWVLENAIGALKKAGYEEKRVNGLIEMALLIYKMEAEIRSID